MQLDLVRTYLTNFALYPRFQEYFRTSQIPLLAACGENPRPPLMDLLHGDLFHWESCRREPGLRKARSRSGHRRRRGRPAIRLAPERKRRRTVTIKAVLAVVPVADLDQALEWYELFFGRPADTRPMDTLAEWHLSELGVVQVFHDPDRAGRTTLNFTVDELDATLAELASKGITSTDPQVVSSGSQRLATTSDPDHNQLGLIESTS